MMITMMKEKMMTVKKVLLMIFLIPDQLPCWRSVIDTFLPTQSSSLIGEFSLFFLVVIGQSVVN